MRGLTKTAATVAMSAILVTLLCACGGGDEGAAAQAPTAGPGPAPGPAPAPPPASAPAPTAASLSVLPARLALRSGDEAVLVALSAAPVLWSSSDAAVATVDAQGRVTALAAGSVVISATAGTSVASAALTVHASTAASASALIDAALAAGSIDAERALTYRVFALFADARLPPALDGAPDAAPDHATMREVAARWATLPAATQDLLAPFLVPPIYAESWYAQRAGTAAAARATALASGSGQVRRTAARSVNCEAAALPAFWKRLSSARFNVFHLALGDPLYDAFHLVIAQTAIAVAEEVYAAETGLFNRFPLADTAEPCNGGDGAVDIYLTGLAGGGGAITQSYPGRCNQVPSFILLDYNHPSALGVGQGVTGARAELKSVVAHEFAHVLQFAMNRPAACDDYRWLDEASAQWVMDHVDPALNREHGQGFVANNRRRAGTVFGQYLLSDHMASLELPGGLGNANLNGYADYIFFQYLAKKFDPLTIKEVIDATTRLASVEAVQSALAGKGGFKAVWPDFVLTLWNDAQNQVLDDFSRWDAYDYGLGAIFQRQVAEQPAYKAAAERLRTIEIDQQGQPRASFTLLKNALEFPGTHYEIAPRSVYIEHLKFSDATVHSVYLNNPIANFPNREFMKVQVKKKIGGQWQAVEDWSGEPFKQFCRDKKDERLEELLIFVSNSEAARGSERPFQIPKTFPMQIATSNVGCWMWLGQAQTTVIGGAPQAVDSIARANSLVLVVKSVLPGRIVFGSSGGLVSGNSTVIPGPGCTATSVGATRNLGMGGLLAAGDDGSLDIGLDLDMGFGQIGGTPPDRQLVQLSGFSFLDTTSTVVCPMVNQTSTGSQGWEWLHVDDPSQYSVSTDGQTIEGRFTATLPTGAVLDSQWKFTAVKE